MKKVCKICGNRFNDETHEFICESCRNFKDYKVQHPNQNRKNQPEEIHFAFYRSWTIGVLENHEKYKVIGTMEQDSKNPNHYSITINLYNYNILDKDVLKKICTTIQHEYLHKMITEAANKEASKKADDGLLRKLEEDGYI